MKLVLAAIMTIAAMAQGAGASAPAEPPARFQSEVEAFAAVGQPGASALFLGSSSIRLWDVSRSFPATPVVNRGFGGARTVDVQHHYARVIGGLQPASVIVYVGENDIADGATAEATAAEVLSLLARLRTDLPRARIAYLSMKPTPLRWELYPRISAANALIAAHAGRGAFDYVDVGQALMAVDGRPDALYFRTDGLHLNDEGYRRWTGIVDRYLQPANEMAGAGVKTAR